MIICEQKDLSLTLRFQIDFAQFSVGDGSFCL